MLLKANNTSLGDNLIYNIFKFFWKNVIKGVVLQICMKVVEITI
jgi:hypothetical protein